MKSSQLNKNWKKSPGNTEKLSSNAGSLMGEFDQGVCHSNGNFVDGFRKVYSNNAYENGVPNVVLRFGFLSNQKNLLL